MLSSQYSWDPSSVDNVATAATPSSHNAPLLASPLPPPPPIVYNNNNNKPRKAIHHRKKHIPVGPAGVLFRQQTHHPTETRRLQIIRTTDFMNTEDDTSDEEDHSGWDNHDNRNSGIRRDGGSTHVVITSEAWMAAHVSLQIATPSCPFDWTTRQKYKTLRPHMPTQYILLPQILNGTCDWKMKSHQRLLVQVTAVQTISDHLWTVTLTDETSAVVQAWMEPVWVRQEQQQTSTIRTGMVWLLHDCTIQLLQPSNSTNHNTDDDDSVMGERQDSRMLLVAPNNVERVWSCNSTISNEEYMAWSETRNNLTTSLHDVSFSPTNNRECDNKEVRAYHQSIVDCHSPRRNEKNPNLEHNDATVQQQHSNSSQNNRIKNVNLSQSDRIQKVSAQNKDHNTVVAIQTQQATKSSESQLSVVHSKPYPVSSTKHVSTSPHSTTFQRIHVTEKLNCTQSPNRLPFRNDKSPSTLYEYHHHPESESSIDASTSIVEGIHSSKLVSVLDTNVATTTVGSSRNDSMALSNSNVPKTSMPAVTHTPTITGLTTSSRVRKKKQTIPKFTQPSILFQSNQHTFSILDDLSSECENDSDKNDDSIIHVVVQSKNQPRSMPYVHNKDHNTNSVEVVVGPMPPPVTEKNMNQPPHGNLFQATAFVGLDVEDMFDDDDNDE